MRLAVKLDAMVTCIRPRPGEAEEIAEDLRSALEQIEEIVGDLRTRRT